ncbi:MAG: PocR ligand-binding domain-containing protein [Candidatus Marinimicrobia bacterium]|nr:PocR ligand-binding domain-containing protein [Candidatus Neomarinimicrobiota bacterium]
MKYPLKYIFSDEIQNILDIFTELFDIRIAFFSTDGRELKVGKRKGLCRYCTLLRNDLGREQTCLDLDQKMRRKAVEQKTMIQYQCHGGMTEAVTPIYMDEDLTGFLMVGQFRTEEQCLKSSIISQWQEKYGNSEIENAFLQTPNFSKLKANYILKLFSILIDYILYRHMVELYGNKSIKPLITYLQSHLEDQVGLSEASRILLQSESSLSHKFKKMTGKSFKQFQIDLKLEKADQFLQKNPELTIKEIAHRLGYSDPYYFSRLYKKYRGCSPSSIRKETD